MDRLPHSLFSTREFQAEERFDAWREDMSLIFDVEDPLVEEGEFFHATFELYNFGQSVFGELHSSSARYLRTRDKILSDGLDSVLIQLFLEGECQFGCGRQTTLVKTGDIVIFDLSRRVDNFNASFRHVTMMVPRELVAAAIPNIHQWHGAILPRDNPAVRLLRNHLISCQRMAPSFDLGAGRHLESATVALTAAATSGKPSLIEGATDDDVELVLTFQIKRYIRESLGSENLSPEALAHKFGISRAQIYRLMEPVGGIARYIRKLRLNRCFEELRNPALSHLTISEIAYRSGFAQLSTFQRNFRETFGLTPGEARERGRESKFPASLSRQSGPGLPKKHHAWFREIG